MGPWKIISDKFELCTLHIFIRFSTQFHKSSHALVLLLLLTNDKRAMNQKRMVPLEIREGEQADYLTYIALFLAEKEKKRTLFSSSLENIVHR